LFNVGLDKSSGNTPSFVWGSGNFTTSDTIFLVGSYTFNTGTTLDDVSQLWINPDASTFSAASAPVGALSSTAGTDLARVASFVLFDRNANEPAGGLIDDLRFGTSWADVTPAAIPEPSIFCLAALGLAGVCSRLRRK
jgi:hypothetical protein